MNNAKPMKAKKSEDGKHWMCPNCRTKLARIFHYESNHLFSDFEGQHSCELTISETRLKMVGGRFNIVWVDHSIAKRNQIKHSGLRAAHEMECEARAENQRLQNHGDENWGGYQMPPLFFSEADFFRVDESNVTVRSPLRVHCPKCLDVIIIESVE